MSWFCTKEEFLLVFCCIPIVIGFLKLIVNSFKWLDFNKNYRKRKYGAIKPLAVSTGKAKQTNLTFSSLLRDMKDQWSSKLGFKTPALSSKHQLLTSSNKDIDYIFVKPLVMKIKSKKEKRISDELDKLGIFQVNLNVILKEYPHTKMS